MNIAHLLTFSRIFIIPFFPLIYLEHDALGISFLYVPYILLGILLVCEITDIVDGMVARKTNTVTDLGKILDPMADTITRIFVFVTFTRGWISIPLALVFVFLFREFMISMLRTVCAMRGVALGARPSGKLKAVVQATVNFLIVILMIPFSMGLITLEELRFVSFIAVSVAAAYTLLSSIDYLYANRGHIKQFIAT
jgi:CDP-diacylglycerol---glycerol-3-phosphate 3-phosphatidyltransferase